MIKSEAKFQTLFNHWLKAEFFGRHSQPSAIFELKHTRGKDYLPFSAVEEHQINALMAASTSGLIYKISDESQGYKPFDCFALRKCDAYIAIKYPSFFVLITIKSFMEEKKRSNEKSLSDWRASSIATFNVDNK